MRVQKVLDLLDRTFTSKEAADAYAVEMAKKWVDDHSRLMIEEAIRPRLQTLRLGLLAVAWYRGRTLRGPGRLLVDGAD